MPETISHYRILRKLGSGGMGEVYLAEDAHLHRPVALKILPAEFTRDADRLRRFLQEAHAESAIRHPNVAHIYDVGEEAGLHFIAMEYVEGQPLQEKITPGPLPLGEILDLSLQLADALDEAHAQGVIHRDLKPSNIMVDARGRVKVLDFGLAKVRRGGAISDSSTQLKTGPGVVLGTVQYMSPEQALGREVDPRSDLFSLGSVMYEMATGKAPFSGSTTTETINQIVHSQPQAIGRLNYSIPGELERIIRKCLEKDPEWRYQSARELLVDLRKLRRDSDPEVVRPVAVPLRRPRRLVWAAAAGALAILAVALVSLRFGGSEVAATAAIDSVAVLPFANVSGDPETEYLGDGITESLINTLSRLPQLRVIPRGSVFQFKGKDVTAIEAAKQLGVAAVLTGRVRQDADTINIQTELVNVRDNAQLWGEQYNRKLADLFALQEEITKDIAEQLRPRLSGEEQRRLSKRETASSRAYELYLKGRYLWNQRTSDSIRKSVEYFQQAIAEDPGYALAYAGLADAYSVFPQYAGVPFREYGAKAKAAAQKALELDDSLAEAHATIALVHMDSLEWADAEREFRRAIELDPDYPTARHWYSLFLREQGRFSEALEQIQRGQQLDPLSTIIGVNVAISLSLNGRYEEAFAQFRQLAELAPNWSHQYLRRGDLYVRMGRLDDALADYELARKLGQASEILAGLGSLYGRMGRRADALRILAELEKRYREQTASAYNLAQVYVGLGEKDLAFEWLERDYREQSGWLDAIGVEVAFIPLHSDPRYRELLKRLGIPP